MEDKKLLLLQLQEMLDIHESMKHAYFFSPSYKAASRRIYEENHSRYLEFNYNGHSYKIDQKTICSCKHVYYHVKYYKDGELLRPDIRIVKKLIKELSAEVASNDSYEDEAKVS